MVQEHKPRYMRVKLLNGFKEGLTYEIPQEWEVESLLHSIVEVPLQKRSEAAIVEEIFDELEPEISYKIRAATSKSIIPSDKHYFSFIKQLSAYYGIDQLQFLRRIRHFMQEKEHDEPLLEQQEVPTFMPSTLNEEQQKAVLELSQALNHDKFFPALLHGVTGSGKTEIYKRLIIEAYEQGKSILFLLPEVSLAVQFSHILKNQLPRIPLFSFHSASSAKEKKALWQHLLNNQPALIIGVHMPVLLPIPHLGLIIIDEEHDVGFQEKKHPRIHTKEAALLRAQLAGIPLIAGSATPSISSLYNVHHRGWHYFELKKRYAGALPTIEVVKLTDKKQRKQFWISKELEDAITQQLAKREQTIIFLNRRGYSFFVQCKACGFIPQCSNCSVSLTLHDDNSLRCHYCSLATGLMQTCTSCKSPDLLKKGIGTQQVVTILEKLFPTARIARADQDTTRNKKKWRETMKDFEAGAYDILVGTQTITKGYHFPRVTLVGVLWADINLSLPIYNAAEITLQQLIQVAGRAGRQSQESRVIIQTMIDHQIFHYVNETRYSAYYDHEIEKRALVNYPPCTRFAEIELKHEHEATVEQEASLLARALKGALGKNSDEIAILGPSQPPVHKIKNICSRKIYLKSPQIGSIIDLFRAIDKSRYQSSIYLTPNPLS